MLILSQITLMGFGQVKVKVALLLLSTLVYANTALQLATATALQLLCEK